MRRMRSNGLKFQEEVKRELEGIQFPFYLERLHTTSVRAIADFILFTETNTIILEIKETSKDSFSERTMQQREKIQEFREFINKVKSKNSVHKIMILVHFITTDHFVVHEIQEELKVLHPNDPYCKTFPTLNESLMYILKGED